MGFLVVCVGCGRHVRSSETACPFCAADVTSTETHVAKRAVSSEGLSRAAVFALVAAGVDLTACDDRPQTSVTHYGAPCAPVPCVFDDGGAGDASPPGDARRRD
jgi:hypothetical protein